MRINKIIFSRIIVTIFCFSLIGLFLQGVPGMAQMGESSEEFFEDGNEQMEEEMQNLSEERKEKEEELEQNLEIKRETPEKSEIEEVPSADETLGLDDNKPFEPPVEEIQIK